MASFGEVGRRLIPTLVDEYCRRDRNRVWASVPIDDEDPSRGYQDVTYRQFANAVNHAAAWLTRNLPSQDDGDFSTFAFAGAKDLRYPIIAVAAAKCRRRLLLCSPFATIAAQTHLLNASQCLVYLHTETLTSVVQRVVAAASTESAPVVAKQVPRLDDFLSSEVASEFAYDLSWEQACSDPWLLMHTSGTTGMPKLIVFTHSLFSHFDAADLMPDIVPGEETMGDLFRNRRFYVALPHLHLVGMMAALQWAVYLNMTLVMGPTAPASGSQVLSILRSTEVQGAVVPPSLIEDVCRQPGGLDALRQLYCLYFAGAPIAERVATQLNGYCKLVPAMGSIETGPAFISVRGGEHDQWQYYQWRDPNGVRFDRRSEHLFESVFHRRSDLQRFQQVFHVYPDIDEYPTRDLWTQHPTRKDLWKYAGRKDDMVILSHAEDLYAAGLEQVISEHPAVKAVVVGGDGRPQPFLLIEIEALGSQRQHSELIDEIWPAVERANEQCSEYVKLSRQLVLLTSADRPLPMTAKNTVQRRAALELYKDEIAQLYEP